jgi:hypothetical protein
MPESIDARQKQRALLIELAQRVADGEPVDRLAAENNVSDHRLRRACASLGIAPRRGRPRGPQPNWTPKTYAGVNWIASDAEIALQLNRSRQAVHQMRQKLERLGMIQRQPRRRIGRRNAGGAAVPPLPPATFHQILLGSLRAARDGDRAAALMRHGRALAGAVGPATDPGRLLSAEDLLDLLDGISGERRAVALLALCPLVRLPLGSAARAVLLNTIPATARAELLTLAPALRTPQSPPKST